MKMTRKGIAAERQLVNKFWQSNYAAIRVPASGAGSKSVPKPDIVVGNGQKYYAFEVKTTKLEKLYLREDEIDELVSFSDAFGSEPLVAVRFKTKTREWLFFEIHHLRRTTSGNYIIDYEEDFSKGLDFNSLL